MRPLVLLAALVLTACPPAQEAAPLPGALADGGTVIGSADGIAITKEMVDSVTARVPADQVERLKSSGRYGEFLDRVALGQVLYQRAIEAGVHEQPEVQVALAMSGRDVLAAELLEKVGTDAVTDEQVLAEYEARAVRYKRPTLRASHILVKELDRATELRAELEGGAEFAVVAAAASMDPSSKDNGGDLGYFEKERMFPEIAEPAFAATPGTLLGPIETRMGYHLVLVTDKRDATPVEEVRAEIEQALREKAIEAYVTELQRSVTITWNDPATAGAPAGDPADPHAGHDHAGHDHATAGGE